MRIPQADGTFGAAEPESKGRACVREAVLTAVVDAIVDIGGPLRENERRLSKVEKRHLAEKAKVSAAVAEAYSLAEDLRGELMEQLPPKKWAEKVVQLCNHETPAAQERGLRLWAEYSVGKAVTRTENHNLDVHVDAQLDPGMMTETPAAAEAMGRMLLSSPSGREALAALLGVDIPAEAGK